MKFNTVKKTKSRFTNHARGEAMKLSPEMELYTAVATGSLQRNSYETADSKLSRIFDLFLDVDPEFIAKLAIYTREKMHMRSIPIILVVELAKFNAGTSLVSKTVARIVKRADEITEILAYYQLSNVRKYNKKLNKLSKQIQKGLAYSFNQFDEYQFAKYNRKTEVTLRDALFLVHPKAKDDAQQVIFDKIANKNLDIPYTWEVEISKLGQETYQSVHHKERVLKEKWQELIESGKLGYMALLRNLRNILQAKVGHKHAQIVAETLSNPDLVKRSKQLPFRYLAAYREVVDITVGRKSLILKALGKAIALSVENIKGFDAETKVLIASDVSGSMYSPISPRSKIRMYDVGLVLSMLMEYRSTNVTSGIFGNRWLEVNLPNGDILENVEALNKLEGKVGYSTNAYFVIDDLINKEKVMDKVLIFTDVQLWDSTEKGNALSKSWYKYKKIAPEAKLYLFDLTGYGSTPLSIERSDVHLIAGWSDKVFEVMDAVESGASVLDSIYDIEL